MADERRPSPSTRGPRNRPAGGRAPSAPLTGPLVVDAATSDALRLFNARLGAQAENEKAERRVQKAAKAKDDAAGRVRNLENDTKATAEQRAEAAAAYRTAVEAWERARNGEAEPTAATSRVDAGPEEPADAPADAPADDPAEEPAAETAADTVAEADVPAADTVAEAESTDEPHGAATADH
jgi:hypothetical protein